MSFSESMFKFNPNCSPDSRALNLWYNPLNGAVFVSNVVKYVTNFVSPDIHLLINAVVRVNFGSLVATS